MDVKAFIAISANVKGQQEVERLRKSMGALDGAVLTLRKTLGVLGVAITAQQFGLYVKGTIDAADALNDLRQVTGISVEELSALGLTAEQSGTSLDAVAKNVGRLARLMGDAAGGSKSAIAVLTQFGFSTEEMRKGTISATDALARIADRFQQMPDGLRKSAAAQALFGKSAGEIIPLLNGGGDAIRKNYDELARYGGLMSGSFAAAADAFNDRIATLQYVSRGLGSVIAEAAIPPLLALSEVFLEVMKDSRDLAGDNALQQWAEAAGRAIALLVDGVSLAVKVISHVGATARMMLADVSYATEWATSWGGGAEQEARLAELWKQRMAAEEDLRKSLDDLINGDKLKYTHAFENALTRNKWDAEGLVASVEKALSQSKTSIDLGADKEANRALEQRLDLLKQQSEEIADFVLRENEAINLLTLEGKAVNMSSFEYQQLVDAKRREYEIAQATSGMLPETAALYEQVAGAMFATRQELERLNYEQSRTFDYGVKTALKEYAESATNTAEQVGKAVTDGFQGMEDALVDFVRTGKLDFKDLIDSMIADLARLAIRQAILGPIAKALGGVFSTAEGVNQVSEGVNQTAGTMSTAAAQGALFGAASAPPPFLASGGGLTGPARMRAGNVQVVVNNNSGQQVDTRETTDGRGNRRVEVTVGDLVASEIRRPGSSANLAIRQSFGARQTLTGR